MKSIGNRIKYLRKKQGKTMMQLSGKYMTQGMLSLIENNKTRASMDNLQYLADQLGVTVSYLIEEGDEEWTAQIFDKIQNVNFQYPSEIIEKELIPNLDQLTTSETAVNVLRIARNYLRHVGESNQADQVTERIVKIYNSTGYNNLAVKEKVIDVNSLMIEGSYERGLMKINELSSEIESVGQIDPRLQIDYFHSKIIFELATLETSNVIYTAKEFIRLCRVNHDYRYFYQVTTAVAHYCGLSNEVASYNYFRDCANRYADLAELEQNDINYFEGQIGMNLCYVHTDATTQIALLEAYKEKLEEYYNDSEDMNTKQQLELIELEIRFHQGDYAYVREHFDYNLYDRPYTQTPMDRIMYQTRALIFPLSLFHLKEESEARKSYMLLEENLSDIKHLVYMKEFYKVKSIIF